MYKLIGADGKEYGPVAAEVVRQWIAEGRANGLTQIQPEGATEWKSLRNLSEFAPALGPMEPTTTPAPFSAVPPQRTTNPLATTGLILGILSLTIGLCCCSGFPFSIAGLICSGIALSQIGKNPQQEGRGMAIAGLALSVAGLLLGILIMIFYGIVASMPDVMRKLERM